MKGVPLEGGVVVLTVRLSARDRVLLDRLVELDARELAELGVEITVATVLRRMIRAAAKERGVDLPEGEVPVLKKRAPARAPKVSQDKVRKLLVRLASDHRGLGAEIARRFEVEATQVSKFKNGHEAFPAAKLDALYAFLREER
jgi:hypothetical protein